MPKRRYLSTLLVILILLAIPVLGHMCSLHTRPKTTEIVYSSAYEEHVSVDISGNGEFSGAGFTGSGTPENPYILEDKWIIDDYSICIRIENTDAYFEIRDSMLVGITAVDGNIILNNVKNGRVIGTTANYGTYGLYCINSANISLEQCNILNSDIGIYSDNTDNLTIFDCNIYDSTTQNIVTSNMVDLLIEDSEIHDCEFGIHDSGSNNSVIRGCSIYNITASHPLICNRLESDGTNLDNCSIFNCYHAVYLSGDDCVVRMCRFYNIYRSIILAGIPNLNSNHTYFGNTILGYGPGLFFDYLGSYSSDFKIVNNTIHHHASGIGAWEWYVQDSIFVNNTIYGNEYGILMMSDGMNNFTGNKFGWNGMDIWDGYGSLQNFNDSTNGNMWSRYSGSGAYNVPNVNGIDYYPQRLEDLNNPMIDPVADLYLIEGSTDMTLNWSPSDQFPYAYSLYRDGIIIDSGDWLGGDLSFIIGALLHNTYNYTLVVSDAAGNSASDTIFVFVEDIVPPYISSIGPTVMIEDTMDNWLNWTVGDTNPDWYTIYVDGAIVEEDIWIGEYILYNLDSFGVGSYNVTIVIEDTAGLRSSDSVLLTVLDILAPELDNPPDLFTEYGQAVTIGWTAYEKNPSYVEAYSNDSLVYSSEWSGASVLINFGELEVGFHNLTLRLNDTSGHISTDTVFAIVEDKSKPIIQFTSYAEAYEGSDFWITWVIYEPHPGSYKIEVNGFIVQNGTWESYSINYNTNGLPAGQYEVRLTAIDKYGNEEYGIVILRVFTSTVTYETTPSSTSTTMASSTIATSEETMFGILQEFQAMIGLSIVVMISLGVVAGASILMNIILFRREPE